MPEIVKVNSGEADRGERREPDTAPEVRVDEPDTGRAGEGQRSTSGKRIEVPAQIGHDQVGKHDLADTGTGLGRAERRSGPAYLQIADDLRSQILDGALQEGDRLPSEADLMADYGVSRIVARDAVKVLETEGLVVKRQGSGTFVRTLSPPEQRIVGDFYAVRPTGSPFARATRAAGRQPEWEYQSRSTTAPKAIAARLGISPGDPIMKTNYRFFADGVPVMLSTSYEPLAVTGGTPVEQPEAGPVTGVIPRMDTIGMSITQLSESVTARAPRPYEGDALNVPPGTPVLAIERTYFAGETAVETADIIVSADRYTLVYHVPIPPEGTKQI